MKELCSKLNEVQEFIKTIPNNGDGVLGIFCEGMRNNMRFMVYLDNERFDELIKEGYEVTVTRRPSYLMSKYPIEKSTVVNGIPCYAIYPEEVQPDGEAKN